MQKKYEQMEYQYFNGEYGACKRIPFWTSLCLLFKPKIYLCDEWDRAGISNVMVVKWLRGRMYIIDAFEIRSKV